MTSTARRSDAVAISTAFSIAAGVSSIAQIIVWSGAPADSMSRSTAATSAALSTFGTTMPAGPAAAAERTSASCHSVSIEFTRIVSSRRPYAPLVTASATLSRATAFMSGATESSVSKMTASVASPLAFSSALSLAPGMYSALRRGSVLGHLGVSSVVGSQKP